MDCESNLKFSAGDVEKVKVLLQLMNSLQLTEGSGESIACNIQMAGRHVTLGIFRDEYLKYLRNNRSYAYFRSVEQTFIHLLRFFPEHRLIDSVGLKDAEEFFDYLKKNAPKGFYVYYRNLRSAFNKAEQWSYIPQNVLRKLKLAKKMRTNPAYINEEQLGMICKQIRSYTIKNIIRLGFYSGMRLAELTNLTWPNVDLQNKVITVGDVSFETKNKRTRVIPLADEAFNLLNSTVQKCYRSYKGKYYVFTKSNHRPYTNDCISKTFKKACRKAGMSEEIHFHSLRHSTASLLVSKGVPIYTVSKILGHSSVSTTEIYSHLDLKVLRDAINVFN